MKERIIRNSLWSKTFQKDQFFLKRYKFYEPKAVTREIQGAIMAAKANINTPKFISVCNDHAQNKIFSVFEYTEMQTISNDLLLSNDYYLQQYFNILDKFKTIKWDKLDDYWSSFLMKEFDFEFSFLDFDTTVYSDFLRRLTLDTFIHGDLACGNMGLANNTLFVFDFQHACIGPEGWDKAYLAGTMPYSLAKQLNLNSIEERMALIVSAIKLGRSIKKHNTQINVRSQIYETWVQNIKI